MTDEGGESVYGSFDAIEIFGKELQDSIRSEYDNKINGLKTVGFRHGKLGYSWILLSRDESPKYCVNLAGGQSSKRLEDYGVDEIQFYTLEEILAGEYETFG